MSIRRATVEDAAAISALVASLSHYYLVEPEGQLPLWFRSTLTEDQFQRRIGSPAYDNYVYVIDDVLVGYIAIKEHHHVFHLFVAEQHQGQGLARQLWQHVLATSSASHFTLRASLYAVPVYRAFGFVNTCEVGEKDGIAFQPMAYGRGENEI